MARNTVMNDGGISPRQIKATFGVIASAVSAAGSTQSDATLIDGDLNLITTASAGQGVVLPSFPEGDLLIANGSAVAVLVYPTTGGKINNGSANAAITLYPGLGIECTAISATDVLAVYVAIPAGSVVTASLADDAVTYAKIQNISASPRILCRKTASAGDTEEGTLSEVLDFIQSATKGDLLVRDTSAWARLAASTSGHVLTAQGAGALPAYAAPAAQVIQLIASGAISSAATVDIPLDGNTWDEVEFKLIAIQPATDNVEPWLRFSQDGGSTFLAGASDYAWAIQTNGTGGSDAADSEIALSGQGASNVSDELATYTITIYRPGAASFQKNVVWYGGQVAAAVSTHVADQGWGKLIANTNAITDARFLYSSGNIASGFYYAIGKKYS